MTKTDVAFIKELLEHRGWFVLRKHLEEQVQWCTDRALDPDDEEMLKTITLTKRDLMIKWRKYNQLLSNLPESIIASFEGAGTIEQPTDFDPYMKEKDLEKK